MKVAYLVHWPGIASRTPDGFRHVVMAAGSDGSYREEDLRQLEDADVIVVGLQPVDERVLDRSPRLKLVQRLGRGFCNVDLDAAERRSVAVCTMPDFNAATVAEHALMMMLALLRRVFDSTLLMKAGRWPVKSLVTGGIFDLQGRALGIVGLGAIGRAVAVRARAFGVRLSYHDDRVSASDPDLQRLPLPRLLAESDIVTLHLPLTPATRHVIGEHELALMKPTALLINTARGDLVDEAALAAALQQGAIAGAGIDVFSHEPLDGAHPLARSPNVLLTPHTGGQTQEAMERMVAVMVENLERVRRGEDPRHRLTRSAGGAVSDG